VYRTARHSFVNISLTLSNPLDAAAASLTRRERQFLKVGSTTTVNAPAITPDDPTLDAMADNVRRTRVTKLSGFHACVV
jgi:hypothetical protein